MEPTSRKVYWPLDKFITFTIQQRREQVSTDVTLQHHTVTAYLQPTRSLEQSK